MAAVACEAKHGSFVGRGTSVFHWEYLRPPHDAGIVESTAQRLAGYHVGRRPCDPGGGCLDWYLARTGPDGGRRAPAVFVARFICFLSPAAIRQYGASIRSARSYEAALWLEEAKICQGLELVILRRVVAFLDFFKDHDLIPMLVAIKST